MGTIIRSTSENDGSLSSSSPSSIRPRGEGTRAESTFWNILSFIFVGITLLYACDTLQLNNITEKGIRSHAYAEGVVFKTMRSSEETNETSEISPSTLVRTQPVAEPATNSKSSSDIKGDSIIDDNHGFDKKYAPFVSIMKNGDVEYYTYTPRGRDLDDNDKQALINQWGKWNFNGQRLLLSEDFYQKYPNRDVPRKEFPAHAWQIDTDYLSGFLPEAVSLVQRAQEAILAEYGQPSSGSWEERTKMFTIDQYTENLESITLTDTKGNAIVNERGGWTTPESWIGLKRRMLHSIMTEDSFVFAMGGHSSSAGHGNHFQQSYTYWKRSSQDSELGIRLEILAMAVSVRFNMVWDPGPSMDQTLVSPWDNVLASKPCTVLFLINRLTSN
jgi:hypothetical protein